MSDITIRRIKQHHSRYTVMDNGTINDPAIPMASLGLLTYLLSKPDDWTVDGRELARRFGCGREAIQTALRKLKNAGYARLVSSRGELGTFSGRAWEISEVRLDPSDGEAERRLSRPTDEPSDGKPGFELTNETDAVPCTETAPTTKNDKVNTPQPPISPAGNPADQIAERPVPTRGAGSTAPSRAPRSTKSDRAASPAGDSEARGGRWAPVAAAIMAAIGRPAPRGKLPSWLGNAVATFGAAAGDDPAAAMVLVAGWAKSRPLREALERGIVRDHTVPAMVGSWIAAGNGGQPPAGVAQKADPQALRMQRLGAPDNWRELVYTHDGTKRSPVLALPRMGLGPYTTADEWPTWYRAFEGVEA